VVHSTSEKADSVSAQRNDEQVKTEKKERKRERERERERGREGERKGERESEDRDERIDIGATSHQSRIFRAGERGAILPPSHTARIIAERRVADREWTTSRAVTEVRRSRRYARDELQHEIKVSN